MKCFIAMAFSHKDTDIVYDDKIHPLLLARNIEPIRVDRLVHNDSIDDVIIEQIKAADFAIVDLTYARPSVYYEAGFAERIIPVIYTIRRDHLSPINNDEFGNYKVHFDLSMKNMIDWISSNDAIFNTRLSAMIDKVIKPLLELQEQKRLMTEKSIAFSKLSIYDRKECIEQLAAQILNSYNFYSGDEVVKHFGVQIHYLENLKKFEFFAHKKAAFRTIYLDFTFSNSPYVEMHDYPSFNLNMFGSLNKIESVEEHILICSFLYVSFEDIYYSLHSLKPNNEKKELVTIQSINLPDYPVSLNGEIFLAIRSLRASSLEKLGNSSNYTEGFYTTLPPADCDHELNIDQRKFKFVYNFPERSISRIITIHVIDSISSEDDFLQRLRKILDEFKD